MLVTARLWLTSGPQTRSGPAYDACIVAAGMHCKRRQSAMSAAACYRDLDGPAHPTPQLEVVMYTQTVVWICRHVARVVLLHACGNNKHAAQEAVDTGVRVPDFNSPDDIAEHEYAYLYVEHRLPEIQLADPVRIGRSVGASTMYGTYFLGPEQVMQLADVISTHMVCRFVPRCCRGLAAIVRTQVSTGAAGRADCVPS